MAAIMQVEGGANRIQQHKQQTAANHQFPVPLVSRLDHLDSLMKYLEGKQNSQKGGGGGGGGEAAKQQTAAMLEVAMREAYFKGSLMDRVASLEHRLFQVEEEREEEGETKGKDSKKGSSSSKNNSKTRKEEKNCRSNGNTSSNKKQIKWPQIRPLKLLGC
ncbi:unnamed protein product [Linum tenue]|uniref:Uncharacterized protein n=1 Tax=Linum tenue TaxID=586396 RepID=A0AAV0PL89_9ROSI|nr:unnamed protein product [Linum tenue]